MPNNAKPNILVIMSDEHDPGVTGCYGDDIVETPALDKLASRGVTFDAAYTTSPLCVPARLSFTAGKYVSRCGGWSNDCWLPSEDCPSIAGIMNDAGYDSVLCGKMHYDRHRRYGFRDLGCRGNDTIKTGKCARRDPDSTDRNVRSWEGRTANFRVGDESGVMSKDLERTRVAKEYISSRTSADKPFFMLLGYISPHFPLIVPQKYYDIYKDRVPMPEIPDGFLETRPTNYKQIDLGFGIDHSATDITKRGRELYWGLVTWMDEQIGEVLDCVADSKAADNTIVIYTSDHGENKGDHGAWWRNNMYEHSARVPLIVSWPARWAGGQRRTGACSLVDLVQTIARLGEAEAPDDWDGDSMLDWLDDGAAGWKDVAVSEYYAHNISSGFAMIRQGPWKYVYHNRMDNAHGPERELYNLTDDPGEFSDLASVAGHEDRINRMHAKLIEEVGRDPEEAEAECRRDYATGYGRSKKD